MTIRPWIASRCFGLSTALFVLAGGACDSPKDGDDGAPTSAGSGASNSSGVSSVGSSGSDGSSGADGISGGNDSTAGFETDGETEPRRVPCETPATQRWVGNIYYQGESTDDTRLDGYNVVTGNVDVIGAANVDFLRCVTEVQGVISIRGTSITDLAGLGQLTEAGGISVTDNPNLVVFRGLESLATLGDLTVSANPALIRIEGPANVTRLGDSSSKDGALQIRGNDVLTQLTGFDKLVAIEGNLVVRENPLLDDISGLFGLKALGGRFVMASNPELCISQVNKVGAGLVQWTMMGEGETSGNKEGC